MSLLKTVPIHQQSKLNQFISFRGDKQTTMEDVKSSWGRMEQFKQKTISSDFLDLGKSIETELNNQWKKYKLCPVLQPKIVFTIPDNMLYRCFTPIRSIQKRLQDAQKRIDNTLYEPKEVPQTSLGKAWGKVKEFAQKIKAFKIPKQVAKDLQTGSQIKDNEALRAYMFDNTKTACAVFNLSQHQIKVDMARYQALKKDIMADEGLKKRFPEFDKTFKEMLAADIVLKYFSLSGTDPTLFNVKLLKESFKTGAKFFLPPIPGVVDSLIAFGVMSKNYVTGMKNFKEVVTDVNAICFNETEVIDAMVKFPLLANESLKVFEDRFIHLGEPNQPNAIERYSRILEQIKTLPEDVQESIGEHKSVEELRALEAQYLINKADQIR